MNALRITVALASLAVTNLTVAEPGQISLVVTIDTNKPGPEIDRNIYGQFAEHKGTLIYDGIWAGEDSSISNTRGIRNDVVAALRKLHVPVVRWPGGCFADVYHWRDGIGPRERRPKRIGFYTGQVEANQFGTHEFMDFVDQIGAEPYVSINVGSGSVQEAREWLEYMTATEGSLAELRRENGRSRPWNVKYVGIGNEMWQCGGNMRPDYYVDNLRRYSEFLSNGTRYLIASGPLNDDYEWTKILLQNASWTYPHGEGDSDNRVQFFRGISLHYYTYPEGGWLPSKDLSHAIGFSEDKWFSTLRSPFRLDEVLAKHAAVMDQYDADRSVALVVDEWGASYAPESKPEDANLQQNSLRDALLAALTFNVFHRHSDRVKMANISMMVNVFQSMILTDNDKILLTPTYHVFDLYQVFQGASPYPTSISGPRYKSNEKELPLVDVSVARGKDGKTYLALVNLDPHRSAEVKTNLSGRASGKLITGPQMDSHNTFNAPNSVSPTPFAGIVHKHGRLDFLLPAKSLAVVAIQ